MSWLAAATFGGSIASGLFGKSAAEDQMDFQQKMSKTAHQRAAKDMEKAGLNRVLAVGSPASTPGGAMAHVPDYGSSIAAGLSASIAKKQADANVKQAIAQTSKVRTEQGIGEIQQQIDKEAWDWINKAENANEKKAFLGAYMSQKAGLPTWGGLLSGLSDIVKEYVGDKQSTKEKSDALSNVYKERQGKRDATNKWQDDLVERARQEMRKKGR